MDINATLIGQMITFIIFVVFTMKFVWPNFQDILHKRKLKIEEGLNFSNIAKKKLEDSLRKSDIIIKNAKDKSLSIIDNATSHANKVNEEAKISANIIRNKIVALAEKEASLKMKNMQDAIKKEIIYVAINMAEKIVMKNISKKTNNIFLNDMMNKINK